MKIDYKKEILNHNIEKFSLRVKDDIDMFLSNKILTQANKSAVLYFNSVNDTKKIRKDLKGHIKRNRQIRLQYS